MKDRIDLNHPYWHIRKVAEIYPSIKEFYFSYYHYYPKTIEDERKTFKMERHLLLQEEIVQQVMENTPSSYELAFHSLVVNDDNEIYHLPLIDMHSMSFSQLKKFSRFIEIFSAKSLGTVWFDSGRSYHGYGSVLLKNSEWVAYMGRILLANDPTMPPIVDPRWVGHRLMGGYAALRWTMKTSQYKTVPKLLNKDTSIYPKIKY